MGYTILRKAEGSRGAAVNCATGQVLSKGEGGDSALGSVIVGPLEPRVPASSFFFSELSGL